MLRGIHKASSNWLGKAVMAVVMGGLAISFAIWGIGDIFRGFGRSTVAKIGGTEITIDQFRLVYNDRLQQIGRQSGRPVTPEMARQLGLDRQIVGQLVAETALDERARRLGLNLSNQEVARQIMADPLFQGPTGGFDRLRFEQLLRNASYTEARYTQEQRRIALRRQLADTIGGGIIVPQTAAETVNRYATEQRSIDYIALEPAQAGEIAPPTPEALMTYYQDHKAQFRAPEYRAITLLTVTPADLAAWITVSDEDAKRAYEDRSARYVVPERRQLQQIVFPNAQDAKAASDRLTSGAVTFAQLATERNLSDKDTDLGLLAKSAIVDRQVADAAFSLAEGQTSAPISSPFGTVLIHVVKIEPQQVTPFEQVAPELKREIALDRARIELQSRHDKIEDERASGLHLDEVAKKLGLPARSIEAIDRSGRSPSGEPIADLPQGINVITPAFATPVGVEADPIELPGGGYVWFEVVSVQPSRERSFEEVKDRVEERWRTDQQAAVLKTKADDLLGKLKAGTSFADAAKEAGTEAKTAGGLRRNATTLPAPVVAAVFRTDKDALDSVEGNSPAERYVFRVTGIETPPLDQSTAEARQMIEQLRRSISEDLVTQYIVQVEQDLGTSINTDALNQVVGGVTPDQ